MRNDWLKDRLKRIGKTSRGLADTLLIPKARITEIIGGRRTVKPGEVGPMAAYLQMTSAEVIAHLEGRAEPSPARDDPPPIPRPRPANIPGAKISALALTTAQSAARAGNADDQSLRLRLVEMFLPHAGVETARCAAEAYAFIVGSGNITNLQPATPAEQGSQPASEAAEFPGWSAERLLMLERLWAAAEPVRDIVDQIGGDYEEVRRIVRRTGINTRWPRGSGGAPLHVPYPLDAPWPPEQPAAPIDAEAFLELVSRGAKAGLARRRANGKALGRQSVWTNELQQRVVELVAGGTRRVCDVCRILKISEASFHKYTSMPEIKRKAAALLAHKGFKYEAIGGG